MTLSNKVSIAYHKLPLIDSLENGGLLKIKKILSENYGRIIELLSMSKSLAVMMQMLPKSVTSWGESYLLNNIDYLCSNVPGPNKHLIVCGTKVDEIQCCMPHLKEFGFFGLINSYAGNIRFSFAGDEGYANTKDLVKYAEQHMSD